MGRIWTPAEHERQNYIYLLSRVEEQKEFILDDEIPKCTPEDSKFTHEQNSVLPLIDFLNYMDSIARTKILCE